MGGAALDVLLAVLLLTALAVIYRLESPRLSSAQGGAFGRLGRLTRRLRYYPALARQAGLPPGRWRLDYWAAKLGGAALLPLLLLEMAARSGRAAGWWLALPAVFGFVLPELVLLGMRRRRRRLVQRALPYFLDLIVAFQLSGLSLIEAFRRAGREGFVGPHPLAREVALVGREFDAGLDAGQAFRQLAERTGVADFHAVTSALEMGVRLGAPVQASLRAQADQLWTNRREDAIRRIHRAEIQVMFPIMLTSFPVFAVLALFPMIMDLIEVFGEIPGLLQ